MPGTHGHTGCTGARSMRPVPAATAFLLALAAGLGLVVSVAGCGRWPPTPPLGPAPPAAAYVEVPYPPPPGRVEIIPPRPAGDAVWVDGQWTSFARERWVWRPGAWVRTPSSAGFTPWIVERRADGHVFFAPPAWRVGGREVPAPEPLALARSGEPSTGGRVRSDDRAGPPDPTDGVDAPRVDVPAALLPDAGLEAPRLAPGASLALPTDAGDLQDGGSR